MVRECSAWGMPLIVRIDTLALPTQRQFSAVIASQGARLAYELGADLAIVNYSGSPETFREALHGIDVPVLVGGGPHVDTDEGLLETVSLALRCGASGVAFGAPMFWKNGQPTPTLASLAGMVLAP
jgi:DhnA family fructose-bisphosphate aldolase class Ia